MNNIEFEAQVKNGIIKIPDQYKELENALIKIKIQSYRIPPSKNKRLRLKQLLSEIQQKNIFKSITYPETWQRNIRDEWEKGIA